MLVSPKKKCRAVKPCIVGRMEEGYNDPAQD
jgi:hypothetical protein